MTKTIRPAPRQRQGAGRGNEQASSGSNPNTLSAVTQDIARGPAKIIEVHRDPVNGEVILQIWQTYGGLTIIDLESKESVFFASYFLPPTPVILDRPGKPKSRYVYRVRS